MKNNHLSLLTKIFFAQTVASAATAVTAFLLSISVGSLPCYAQLPTGWAGIDIGGAASGTQSYTNGVYTVTGAGTGINPNGGDQSHFTYYTISAGGNCRLTARVASFTGVVGAQVGLTVRQGTSSTALMGSVAYWPLAGGGSGNPNPNSFNVSCRAPAGGPSGGASKDYGSWSAQGAPVWLQLVRYGNEFAAYRSSDGLLWSQIASGSGGTFGVTGAIQIGFFVSSGSTGTATATFDNVNLETSPMLAYESSWIGNTTDTDDKGYVSTSANAMWVGADGTCYTTGFWDEGGQVGKMYKNGAVVGPLGVPAQHAFGGSITGDASHVYYYGALSGQASDIFQTDLTTAYVNAMYLQTSLTNPTTGDFSLSGMGAGNGELYLSDNATGQVLVVNPSNPSYLLTYATHATTSQTIDTSGVTNPAPQAVYQTAFQQDLIQVSVPGLTVGNTYTVRLHLAELNPNDNAVGKRVMNLGAGSQSVSAYDLYAATGAVYKAAVVTLTGVTSDGSGNLFIYAQRNSSSQDGWAILNGIEIDNSNGSVFKLLDCGGNSNGSWQSTIQEIPSRDFAFTRPGPIAVDKNGNLWIVQQGTTFPTTGNFTSTPGWAAIKLYNKMGVYQGKQITDVVDPTALAYDGVNDRLLVAENGPAQNVRIYSVYSGTNTAAVCTSTLGANGGVFAGSTPGLIHDPASGGDARFFGLSGVGLDSSGNIYVSCETNTNAADIRAFNSSGTLLWSLKGLEDTQVGDFDPTVNASDVWTGVHHYTMNYSGSTAGGEWSLKSYLTNPFNYSFPYNVGSSNTVFRRISGTPVLYTGDQGGVSPITLYRFSGEQTIPCGEISDAGSTIQFWADTNGDGIQQPGEIYNVNKPAISGALLCFSVDNSGNLYLALAGRGGPGPCVQRIPFQGFNSYGVPQYSTTSTSVNAPVPFNGSGAWGNGARLVYAGGALDTMYLLGDTHPQAQSTDYNYGGTLACYDHWSTSPTTRYITVLPDPATSTNFANGAPPYYDGNGFLYMGFDVANGIAFCSDLWGTLHVIDPYGKSLTNLVPGPEICGGTAWEDEAMGVRAHYNSSTGEYDILQENSGFDGKENFYRWKSPLLVVDTFTAADNTALQSHTPDTDLPGTSWTYTGSTGTFGPPTILSNTVRFNSDEGAAVSINNSVTGYTKPVQIVLKADLCPGTVTQDTFPRGVGLGFYSTPDNGHSTDYFMGLELAANGTLQLVNFVGGNITVIASQSYTLGTFNPSLFHTVRYQVNTNTGGIYNVVLSDSNGTETYAFNTNIFTNSSTAYAGCMISAPTGGEYSYSDNFYLEVGY